MLVVMQFLGCNYSRGMHTVTKVFCHQISRHIMVVYICFLFSCGIQQLYLTILCVYTSDIQTKKMLPLSTYAAAIVLSSLGLAVATLEKGLNNEGNLAVSLMNSYVSSTGQMPTM